VLEGGVLIHNDERPFTSLPIEFRRPLLVKDQPFQAMVHLSSDRIPPRSRGDVWALDAGGVEVVTYADRIKYERARVLHMTIALSIFVAVLVGTSNLVRRSRRKR
jgi:hypothetical protein